jgi:hypothetical protein
MLWKNRFSGVAGQVGNDQERCEALKYPNEEEDEDEEGNPDIIWEGIKQMRIWIDELRGVVEDLRNELKQSGDGL